MNASLQNTVSVNNCRSSRLTHDLQPPRGICHSRFPPS